MQPRKSRVSYVKGHATSVAFLALALAVPSVAVDKPEAPIDDEVKRVASIYALVEKYAADPVDLDTAFYQGAIPGLLHKLDPHSVFFDPGQFEQLGQMERSTSKGFGTVVSVLPGRVIVLQAMPGTPSARAGISPGDEILAVNNIRIDRLDLQQLIGLLSEAKQRPAEMYVRRQGAPKLLQFKLAPEEMQSKSVDRAFSLRPGIGFIRIASFDPQTGAQFREALDKLGGANLKGLVIDLRNNPGGVVTSALQIASLFLPPKTKLLTVRGRRVPSTDETVPEGLTPFTFPLTILINEKSASASEILTGALQDHDRATVVGEPSYGKGLVQSVFPLSEKTGVALTTALYYTPSGRSIQKPFQNGEFALSSTAAHPNQESVFHTDKGRALLGGGGIMPDVLVYPDGVNRLRAAMEGSGSFTSFATDYTRRNSVPENFRVTATLLDEFRTYLSERRIQPGLAEWLAERDYVAHRLEVEIVNQSLGVEKGDEIEMQHDPQVRKALEAMSVE